MRRFCFIFGGPHHCHMEGGGGGGGEGLGNRLVVGIACGEERAQGQALST